MTDAPQTPTEQELRQAYEQQIKQIRVQDLLLENVVTLLNLGMRRTGLAPGTEDERDPAQVKMAIEFVRVVLPLLESSAPEQVKPIRDALSRLQMAYVKLGGGGDQPPASAPEEPDPAKPGEPGPAQRSGRLWVPGQ